MLTLEDSGASEADRDEPGISPCPVDCPATMMWLIFTSQGRAQQVLGHQFALLGVFDVFLSVSRAIMNDLLHFLPKHGFKLAGFLRHTQVISHSH